MIDFNTIKQKKIKLQRGQSALQTLIKDHSPPHHQNAFKKFNNQNPEIDKLQHYSLSDYSDQINNEPSLHFNIVQNQEKSKGKEINFCKLERIKQKYHRASDFLDEIYIQENARDFVSRLKKQKEYYEGRFFIKKKKEERRKIQEQKVHQKREFMMKQLQKNIRINRAMENILLHEEKLRERQKIKRKRARKISSKLYQRSKTQNTVEKQIYEQKFIENNSIKMQSLREKSPQIIPENIPERQTSKRLKFDSNFLGKKKRYTSSVHEELPLIQSQKKRLKSLSSIMKQYARVK